MFLALGEGRGRSPAKVKEQTTATYGARAVRVETTGCADSLLQYYKQRIGRAHTFKPKKREEKALASQQGVEDGEQDVDIEMQEADFSLNQPTHATLPGRALGR